MSPFSVQDYREMPRYPLPEVARVLPPEPAMASELWLLTHPDLRRTARVRAFMDALARSLRRDRPLLEGRTANGVGGG